MTKRDLVKWLEKKREEAVSTANNARTEAIDAAKEVEYKLLGLDGFLDDICPLFDAILDKYKSYLDKVNEIEGISMSRYHWQYGYNDLCAKFGDRKRLRRELIEIIRLDTESYKEVCNTMRDSCRKVETTYDTVIETVKNLPTYKDGLEYLKKLGFDISEIQPAEVKKQLPATISVNVDVKYLLLKKKEENKDEVISSEVQTSDV